MNLSWVTKRTMMRLRGHLTTPQSLVGLLAAINSHTDTEHVDTATTYALNSVFQFL